MRITRRRLGTTIALAAIAMTMIAVTIGPGTAIAESTGRVYRVTLVNLTGGQPFSPPVFATHAAGRHIFQVGGFASDQIAAIAQDGDPMPLFDLLDGAPGVREVVVVPRPLTALGTIVGDFNDSVTLEIHAGADDRLSFATMLICTNDGFLGLDAVRLPDHGSSTFAINGYDAGRERNTERSQHIVDPCSGLNPGHELAGDPDGNIDDAVENVVPRRIKHHPGIVGERELDAAFHGWYDPVAVVVVTRVA